MKKTDAFEDIMYVKMKQKYIELLKPVDEL
jgi:hypothetical protein